MNFLRNLKEKTTNLAGRLKEEYQKLTKENEELAKKNEEEENLKKNAALPWEGLRQINSTSNGSFTDVIREEILALSQNEENFLIEEDNYMYDFGFSLDDYIYVAIKVIEHDPQLGRLRNKLVPKKIQENEFWKNYFYQVEVIKLKYNMQNKIKPLGKPYEEPSITNPSAEKNL